MTALPERLLDLAAKFGLMYDDYELIVEAATALQSSVGGEVVAALRGLPSKWRNEADTCPNTCGNEDRGYSNAQHQLADELDAILASPAQPSDGWRTMDSAPRDGTEILIYFARDGVGVRQVAYTEGAHNDYESWCVDDLKFGPYPLRRWCDGDAIAWMPLPAAPSAPLDVAGGG